MNKISILLPTRNRSDMLRTRSIPSVLNQTYRNWELLVVGDCCTDDSGEVVNSFNDARVKWFNLPEKIYHYPQGDWKAEWLAGPVMALNKGLEMASGDWIARLDDDDEWLPSSLDSRLNFALEHGYDFVSAHCLTGSTLQDTVLNDDGSHDVGTIQTWMYSAKYQNIKYNPDCWRKSWNAPNEYDLLERLKVAGIRQGFLDKVTCLYEPRPNLGCVGSKAYEKEWNQKNSEKNSA